VWSDQRPASAQPAATSQPGWLIGSAAARQPTLPEYERRAGATSAVVGGRAERMARPGSQVSRRSVVARSCLRAWRGMGKPTLWTTSPTRQWMAVLVLVGSATSTVRAQCASAGLSHADCTACIATAGYTMSGSSVSTARELVGARLLGPQPAAVVVGVRAAPTAPPTLISRARQGSIAPARATPAYHVKQDGTKAALATRSLRVSTALRVSTIELIGPAAIPVLLARHRLQDRTIHLTAESRCRHLPWQAFFGARGIVCSAHRPRTTKSFLSHHYNSLRTSETKMRRSSSPIDGLHGHWSRFR
jgi:hypothetical protein